MNKVHRVVWSRVHQCLVVVSECTRSQGKGSQGGSVCAGPACALASPCAAAGTTPLEALHGSLRPLLLRLLIAGVGLGLGPGAPAAWAAGPATPPAANQLPTNGQVVAGQASISQSGANMVIQQGSNRAAIDWSSFNVGSGASVQFVQPSSASVTLNRVLDANPSQIFGRISANGQVFLSNPNGLYFSPSATVDVGGLVATTHQISLDDFMAGNTRFERLGATGAVLNEGQLKASLGGYIALLAPEVRNQGLIVAQLGTVALAAGEAFDLQFDSSNTLASVRVSPSTIAAVVDNRTAVLAPGGLIILSALGVRQLQSGVVNNAGHLEASSLESKGGRIVLQGDKITLQATSTLSANGATGGGTVLVGGDWQGSGDMSQALSLKMDYDAVVEANATQSGDGGKVVLWSDVGNAASTTEVAGSISAKGADTVGTGVGTEVLTYSGAVASDAHVLTNGKYISAITLADGAGSGLASDYQLPALNVGNAPVSISPQSLSVSLANTGVTKVYDGTTNAPLGLSPSYSVTGLVAGDTAASVNAGAVLYNSAAVASATTLTASSLVLAGISGSNTSVAGDYSLSNTSASVAASITKAALTVSANDAARFVTQADTANFQGVSFSGLVNGESAADAVGAGPYTVTRPNFATDVAAGLYTGALVPGTLTSANYALSYTNANYTIVPAGRLLVSVANNSNVYGSNASYYGDASGITAQYLDGSNVIQTLAAPTVSGTTYGYNDGAGNLFSFSLTPYTLGASPTAVANTGAGFTPAGTWKLEATGLTGTTGNFSSSLFTVGTQTVTPKAVSVSAGAFAVPQDLRQDIATHGLVATLMDGSALPAWLRWDSTTLRFVASAVPDGALPLQIRVTIGSKGAVIVISERQQS